MTVFNFISLLGGLAFFLYGMTVMSSGLTRMAGSKLERSLQKVTANWPASLLLGAGITIAVQSSSALTVMLIGLVNSGIMDFSQTLVVIMGGNIGTTLTAWILSLTGIQSDNVFLNLLKPENFSLLFALAGVVLTMSKKQRRRDVGRIFVGFAILMFGMSLMSKAMSPLADSPGFARILTAFENPLLGVLVGTVFTGVIQSSAASVGILQSLALTGQVTYGMAIPIIMGQNIGTCITAVLSAFGVTRDARRVAVVHVLMKVLGTVICLSVFYLLDAFLHFAFISRPIGVVEIAFVHTVFNVLTTVMFLPFTNALVKITRRLVPDRAGEERPHTAYIDERLLTSPAFAIAESSAVVSDMAKLARDTVLSAMSLLTDYDENRADLIEVNETKLDDFEDQLGTFLVKISTKGLSVKDAHTVSRDLHSINDFERMGDHAVNILNSAKELQDKHLEFSEPASADVQAVISAMTDILSTTIDAFLRNDLELARKIEPREYVFDRLIAGAKSRHVERLQRGDCTIELGFVLSDLLNDLERISDHCSNIAVCILEIEENEFSTHSYLHNFKEQDAFREEMEAYQKRFHLPDSE